MRKIRSKLGSRLFKLAAWVAPNKKGKEVKMKNTPAGKGLRTAYQSMIGLVIGLFLTIWAVPGVEEAVVTYVRENIIQVVLSVGIPSGFVAWLQNRLGI